MKSFAINPLILLVQIGAMLTGCNSNNASPNTAPDATTSQAIRTQQSLLTYPNGAQGLRNNATLHTSNGDIVLNLGSDNGYYALGIEAGRLMKRLTDYSIVTRYQVAPGTDLQGYGHFLFCFSVLAENTDTEGPYIAFRLNEQRFEVSPGGYEHEQAITLGKPSPTGSTIQAIYRQQGHHGELYIDGQLVGTNDHMPFPSDIFSTIPTNNWIGRAPFKGDKYLQHTSVSQLSIYDYALSDTELSALLEEK